MFMYYPEQTFPGLFHLNIVAAISHAKLVHEANPEITKPTLSKGGIKIKKTPSKCKQVQIMPESIKIFHL